jgi:hypothetical protein
MCIVNARDCVLCPDVDVLKGIQSDPERKDWVTSCVDRCYKAERDGVEE